MRYEQNFIHKLYEFLTVSPSVSPQRPGFDSRPIRVRFVIDKVALEQVFLRILPFLPVSIISLILHIHFQLNSPLLSEGQVAETWHLSNTAMFFSDVHVIWTEKYFHFLSWKSCKCASKISLYAGVFFWFANLTPSVNYLKILHLLHFVVSEVNSFVFVACYFCPMHNSYLQLLCKTGYTLPATQSPSPRIKICWLVTAAVFT
jgi:hypothetical protein